MLILTVGLIVQSGCGSRESPQPEDAVYVASALDEEVSDVATASIDNHHSILDWEEVATLPKKIAIFDHVFWQPEDTESLRALIAQSPLVKKKTVLEIGTGSGIVALCCLQADAQKVVATDINPWAIRNARYNAALLEYEDRLELRPVSQNRADAWAVVADGERFDVILSNPPWELGEPTRVEDFAFYDPSFRLMESFVDGLTDHLTSEGRAFLAYGCVSAVKRLQELVHDRGMTATILDERDLNDLPELFLPGMLIEIRLQER